MVDFTPIENEVLNAMKEIGATTEEKKKTADDIAKKCNRAKSMVTNALVTLSQKGAVKRIAREKAAGYYVIYTPPAA
jgi:predicted transcriptional regulator